MPFYPHLNALLMPASSEDVFADKVVPYLVSVWLDDYALSAPASAMVETTVHDFSYLFDVTLERLIAAWGISRGRTSEQRDKSRMARHPLSAGTRYHRGHAIPHTLGGGTDINLVAQLGSVNVGPFRALEREAVRTPGALYFTYWIYRGSVGQKPTGVEQGLLRPGRAPDIRRHAN